MVYAFCTDPQRRIVLQHNMAYRPKSMGDIVFVWGVVIFPPQTSGLLDQHSANKFNAVGVIELPYQLTRPGDRHPVSAAEASAISI